MDLNILLTSLPAVVTGTIGDGYTWAEAGILALSGVVIVFLMLELLVIITKFFGKIMDSLNGSGKGTKPDNKQKPEKTVNKPVASSSVNSAECSGEIVAVIAAAVDSFYADKKVKPVIRSVKPVTYGRSAWSVAGIMDNTESF